MGSYFVAVIFWCLSDKCAFSYSQKNYATQAECLRKVDFEMANMKQAQQAISAHGTCIMLKQVDA